MCPVSNRVRVPVGFRLALVACLLAAGAALAAKPKTEPAPRPQTFKAGPCDNAKCREFDFWIGEWEVYTPEGEVAGTNTVERILGGCVIHETWEGSKGSRGESFNIHQSGRWHQTWVDNQGTLLLLDGELDKGRMVLEGDAPGPTGSTIRNRISWQPLGDGRVRQHWEMSANDGETWTDVFMGYYVRKARSADSR
jgi:hypothetical protein